MRTEKLLVREPYKKFIYKESRGIRTNWVKVIEDYQEIKKLPNPPKKETLGHAVKGDAQTVLK